MDNPRAYKRGHFLPSAPFSDLNITPSNRQSPRPSTSADHATRSYPQ